MNNLNIKIKQIEDCLIELEHLDNQNPTTVDKNLLHEAIKIGDGFLAQVAMAPSQEKWDEQYKIYNRYHIMGWLRFDIPTLRKFLKELIEIRDGNFPREIIPEVKKQPKPKVENPYIFDPDCKTCLYDGSFYVCYRNPNQKSGFRERYGSCYMPLAEERMSSLRK